MSLPHTYEKQSAETLVMENGIIKQHNQVTKENEDGHIRIEGIINGKPFYIQKTPYEFRHNNNNHVQFIDNENNFREFREVPMKIVRMPTPYPSTRKRRSLKAKRKSIKKSSKGKTAKKQKK